MSKNMKRPNKDNKEGTLITMKDAEESMEKFRLKSRENLNYEIKYFLISISVLLSTNIYIHKKNFNNYNFKIIILIALYFSRRIFAQLWYHYRIRENLIFLQNKIIFFSLITILIIDVIYIFINLLLNYSIYTLLPLFYVSLLQIPIFRVDTERYENAAKEMMRCVKSKIYF
jgi:membrane-associated HD superfamily phosphohydrolase